MASDLVKILEQADQNVPEFLLESAMNGDGASNQSYSNRNRYGGQDVRNDHQQSDYQESEDW